MAQDDSDKQINLFQTVVGHLGLLFRMERRVLGLIFSYSIAKRGLKPWYRKWGSCCAIAMATRAKIRRSSTSTA